jgi:DNA-binding transcriptional MerR regulator/methylmalonyl-CoA mutase cobalamin-binding subunit
MYEPGYSIRVAARLTGVSADKLRMWERRYGFPKPARNANKVRTYSEHDIERLMLVSRAMQAGCRVREAIAKTPEELRELLAKASPAPAATAAEGLDVQTLLGALRADDPEHLRAELRRAVAVLGVRRFITDVAAPLVERVGEAWHDGTLEVRHEHLFSSVLSTQVRVLLSAYEDSRAAPTVVLTTLPGEQHGLGLELAALYLALEGCVVRLLGVDTPLPQIADAARGLRADIVGLSISCASDRRRSQQLLQSLLGLLPQGVQLWVGGQRAAELGLEQKRLIVTVGWEQVDQALRRWREL